MEKTKNCKVSYIFKNNKEIPLLKLTGKWLEDIRLKVGSNLKVYQGKDMLLLIKEN